MATIEQRLSEWQRELLDLTNRNRLLNFRPATSRASSLQLVLPDAASIYQQLLGDATMTIVGKLESEVEEDASEEQHDQYSDGLVGDELAPPSDSAAPTKFSLASEGDAEPAPELPVRQLPPGRAETNVSTERTNAVLLRLAKQERDSEQEQGINILFAVFGLLKWRDKAPKDDWRYAPLVLVPLKIEENVREARFRISAVEADPEINATLIEKLKRDQGLALLGETDSEVELQSIFSTVRTAIVNQPGWEVIEQVHLGLFQFHKLRMYQDLAEHGDIAAGHPIVTGLATEGTIIEDFAGDVPAVDELDRKVPPQDSFTILDADASQLHAIQAAVRGKNLIIHGPPGTGKSQTIANIIAEFVAAGKTVLFVSEKAAAIEVVHRRLTDRGLGNECLMLHSHKANKREVISELGRRLSGDGFRPARRVDELALKRLDETRQQLNAYASALHLARPPLGWSAFQAHGKLAALSELPLLPVVPPSFDDITEERLTTWIDALNRVARHHSALSQGSEHSWFGTRLTDPSLAERQGLQRSLASLVDLIPSAEALGRQLAAHLALGEPTTLASLRDLAQFAASIPQAIALQPAWLDPMRQPAAMNLANETLAKAESMTRLRAEISSTYTDAIVQLARPDVLATYRRGALTRVFSSTYRAHRSSMRSSATDGRQRPRNEELATLEKAHALRLAQDWFMERKDDINQILGVTVSDNTLANESVWLNTAIAVSSTGVLLGRFGLAGPSPEIVERLCTPSNVSRLSELRTSLEAELRAIDAELAVLTTTFEAEVLRVGQLAFDAAQTSDVARWVDRRRTAFDEMDDWLRGQEALSAARTVGMGETVDQLMSGAIPTSQWPRALEKLVITHWLDNVRRNDDVLRQFRSDEHEDVIERFRELDRQYVESGVDRIKRSTLERKRTVSNASGGEPGILSREFNKKRRHLPLRRLFQMTPNLIPRLAPCLMMSPLSVAHFLPADRYHFDAVIFDEASQVRPHDAVGAIMRGKQLIVAGDEHQLPPTSFFDRMASNEDTIDEDQDFLRDTESILKALEAKRMPSSYLSWHYRSRHEDLIAFSNHHIYHNRLITFPSPDSDRSQNRGVRLEHMTDGVYEDAREATTRSTVRVNRREARRVAELVMEHARSRADESLGVVAFNIHQRDVIDDEMARSRLLDRSVEDFFAGDKPEPFFVKALEQVQGDERDVIVISVGYGKNVEGRLSQNFGPVNQDGGERRLNVLTTRAKHQIVVVSSITAADIDLARTQKLGPRLLKNYLDFAERGPIALAAETTSGDGEFESPFEEEVGLALERAGYNVRRQVGCSGYRIDLAVVDPRQPGRYVLGIECDGATYHSSKTARDRDRLRQEILEGLGWTIHRIWSTDWIRQPERELDEAITAINRAMAGQDLPRVQMPSTQALERIEQGAQPNSSPNHAMVPLISTHVITTTEVPTPAIGIPYIEATLGSRMLGNILAAPSEIIVPVILAVVAQESPVHEELLKRRVSSLWGNARVGARIDERISLMLTQAERMELIVRRGRFIWKSGDTDVIVRGPTEDGIARDVDHIPGEEILLAFSQVLNASLSLTQDEIIQQTARVFGYRRTGSDISRRLGDMLRLAEVNNKIERRNGRFQLPR